MKKYLITMMIVCCAFITNAMANAPIATQSNHPVATPSLAPMLKQVTPAVVNIAVEKRIPLLNNLFEENLSRLKSPYQLIAGVGSGVIINAKRGLIVTNSHVVDSTKLIIVTLKDGRRYHAKLVSEDKGFDIAIIKIPADDLTAIKFGDSDQLQVGDFVAAIGSPFGLTQTVTSGVISALNRVTPKIEGFQSFIQTDAPINPGNSGGALVNMKGQLIGINTAIVSPSFGNIGIGFSIPSNMVHSVVYQLLKYGKVKPGMLGVIVQNITADLAKDLHFKNDNGVIVTKVIPNSAAAHADLKVQDVILKVDGKAIKNAAQVHNMLGLMRPGTQIHLSIMRNSKPIKINATVGNPKKLKQRVIPFLMGMRLRQFSELEPTGQILDGVVVVSVADTSPGALSGLITGDVITAANSKAVKSVNDIEKVIATHPKQLLLKVVRNNMNLFLVLQPQ